MFWGGIEVGGGRCDGKWRQSSIYVVVMWIL
jgi:hypothetical protein